MKNFKKGQSLLEIIIVLGMLSIVLPALITGLVSSREGKAQQQQRVRGVSLMQEAIEAAKSVRGRDWATFAVSGTYYPQVDNVNHRWNLVTCTPVCPQTSDGFTTNVVIADVYRDTNGNIVTIGGTLDPSTKKISATVSWTTPSVSSITTSIYVTRYKSIGVTQTTQADFNAGARVNTYITNTSGGEVVLGAGGGGGDWCIPSFQVTDFTLLRNGVNNAIAATDTASGSRVFIGTGSNSSGVSLNDVKLSNSDPPTVLSSKSFDGYKTNDIYGESNASGTTVYAYLATDNNAKEVVIVDLNQYTDPPTNSKYKEIGSIDIPDARNGDQVYVLNDKAYIAGTRSGSSKLFIYNLSADRTTATLQNASGYTLNGTAKELIVGAGGQYAYVATDTSSNNFEIINVSNAASPSRASITTVGSSQTGVDLSVLNSETTVYVAVSYSAVAGAKNVYKIDTTNKSAPVVGLGYNTGGMNPTGIVWVTGNRVIVVGTGGTYQYQVLSSDTMALCSPTSVLQYANGVIGIASVLQSSNGFAYSYINVNENNTPKLKIILGGAGGQYVGTGTFISSTIDSGSVTAFNGFSATVNQPASTTIGVKVGVASPINNSCATVSNFTYLGPNGDPTNSFVIGSDPTTISGAIPLLNSGNYNNPGRCFKYKVFFDTSDPAHSPTLYDFTVNYSP